MHIVAGHTAGRARDQEQLRHLWRPSLRAGVLGCAVMALAALLHAVSYLTARSTQDLILGHIFLLAVATAVALSVQLRNLMRVDNEEP